MKDSFYGKKYGTFSWVRGTIDIHDLDDLKYVALCLKKMRKRIRGVNESDTNHKLSLALLV